MDGPASESASQQASKAAGRKAALTTLVSVFEASLRLLSPFMPFLTEEIWHALYDGNPPAKSIALTSYPQGDGISTGRQAMRRMFLLQDLIRGIREYRKDLGVPEKQSVPVFVIGLANYTIGGTEDLIDQNRSWLEKLSVSTITETVGHDDPAYPGLNWRPIGSTDIAIIYEKQIDVPAERARLTKDIERFEKGIASAERQLGNESFLAKAPAKVVEGLKKQEAETRLLLEKAQAAFAALPAD
jgi:valyl-tRNA synthetase